MVADAGRLHQVFSNLLTNAVRYTPRGGSVTASIEADNAVATITVADTGQGIAPGDLANIFEPFWRGGDKQYGRIRHRPRAGARHRRTSRRFDCRIQ